MFSYADGYTITIYLRVWLLLKKNFKLYINFDFVSNIQCLFQHQLNKQLFLLVSLCILYLPTLTP